MSGWDRFAGSVGGWHQLLLGRKHSVAQENNFFFFCGELGVGGCLRQMENLCKPIWRRCCVLPNGFAELELQSGLHTHKGEALPLWLDSSIYFWLFQYLAPEVLKKQPYDRTVDWWCLGAVLYEMLFGLVSLEAILCSGELYFPNVWSEVSLMFLWHSVWTTEAVSWMQDSIMHLPFEQRFRLPLASPHGTYLGQWCVTPYYTLYLTGCFSSLSN